jgi:hypothetical protein
MSIDLLRDFHDNASRASYHHAADSGDEWREGAVYEQKCKEIFANADEITKHEIRKVAGKYLIGFWWKESAS